MTDLELTSLINLLTKNIRFIDSELIPRNIVKKAFELAKNVDIDDTEFIALTDHIQGKFWLGDKELIKGLTKKGWDKFISNEEIFSHL